MINAGHIYTGILIIDRFPNHSLINLSNLIRFSHLYTIRCTFSIQMHGNIFEASLDQSAGLPIHLNLFRECFKSVLQMKGALYI